MSAYTTSAEDINIVSAYEERNVLDDLEGMLIDGKSFNLEDYYFDKSKSTKLLSFVEFCYSIYDNLQNNYGLYVYIYNPKALNFNVDSPSNKIQFSVTDNKSVSYFKYSLTFLNMSEKSDYYGLFYKFKINLTESDISYLLNTLNPSKRIYNISGIELFTSESKNAFDNNVSLTYSYSGYAKGFGPNVEAESTLYCVNNDLETISLDVGHTFWRSKTSNKGQYYQNQVDTVYFSVPNKFLREYGKLQKILAEWYEYKTKDVIVTCDSITYNEILPYVGVPIFDSKGNELYNDFRRGLVEDYRVGSAANYTTCNWRYNAQSVISMGSICDILYYLLPTPNWSSISTYDPYSSIDTTWNNALYEYILSYNISHENGYLPIKNGNISADLFESDIDEYRKIDNSYGKIQNGYSYYEFDASIDLFDLNSYNPNDHTFRENVNIYGFWKSLWGSYEVEENSIVNQSPILQLKAEYFDGNPEDISDTLLINYNDVDNLKTYYNNAVKNDESVFLFRFAVTDYYSAPVDVCLDYLWDSSIAVYKAEDGSSLAYRSVQSVFFDFDIIELTFSKDDILTVIPVVMSPIDIVNPPTSPNFSNNNDIIKNDLNIFLMIVLLILLLVLLAPVLPVVLRGAVAVVRLPFDLIRSVSDLFKKNNRRPYSDIFKKNNRRPYSDISKKNNRRR